MTTDEETTLIGKIEEYKLMVAVRTDTPDKAYQAAEACIKGGIRFVEITFSVPDAEEVIKKLSKDKRVTVGAGTVLSIGDVKKALKAGAGYIVSPNCDEKVIKFTKKEGAVSIPGACTPTEIYNAYKAGGDIIKLFPFVQIGGLDFLKEIRGPLPFVRYLLSGGLNLDNIQKYLDARPSCILAGSSIIKRELVTAEDWHGITAIAKKFVEKISESLA
ncbi:MAG: bifunctional 4-hydroxy-2-oxoglutarate aldolase/2-dehydro-3-deoxy-phosphogluconate aldolase [Nitrospirae bacterium]|nr:bifunctional 4-hydroxy-2-oxoglutarate aldolase/2-dehydro-3-deoxy-phosphogluconate aldolase [Nitrospirota bacterium]